MKRLYGLIGIIGIVTTLCSASFAAAVMPAAPVTLRSSIIVEDTIVKLGDLFVNAGVHAEKAVAYAPVPGRKAVYDAKWLYRVATAYGLAWRPMSRHDRAVVQRKSFVIPTSVIQDQILSALIEDGAADDLSVQISQRSFRLHVPSDSNGEMEVQDVVYDERTRRFTAVIQAPTDDPRARTFRVSGRVYRIIEIPVLAHRVKAGERISERDIKWIRVRADRLHRDILTEAEDLIGKAPRRTMREGRPLRRADVRLPQLVAKRAIVTLVLRYGSMSLTTKGKALEPGGKGEWIRVANQKTGTIVEGEVIGPNVVAVTLASRIAMK